MPLTVLHRDDSLQATSITSSSPMCVLSNGYTGHAWEAQVDLVISVGGDGTVLSASHFLGDNIPLVGVNSDPTRAEEKSSTKRTDERRSFGALCLCTALDVERLLPKVRCRCGPSEVSRRAVPLVVVCVWGRIGSLFDDHASDRLSGMSCDAQRVFRVGKNGRREELRLLSHPFPIKWTKALRILKDYAHLAES